MIHWYLVLCWPWITASASHVSVESPRLSKWTYFRKTLRFITHLFKWVQWTSEIFFQNEKRKFRSPSDHVMFYLLYKHQWKPTHFILALKCAICCVTKATVIFFTRGDNRFSYSRLKICFHTKADAPDNSLHKPGESFFYAFNSWFKITLKISNCSIVY